MMATAPVEEEEDQQLFLNKKQKKLDSSMPYNQPTAARNYAVSDSSPSGYRIEDDSGSLQGTAPSQSTVQQLQVTPSRTPPSYDSTTTNYARQSSTQYPTSTPYSTQSTQYSMVVQSAQYPTTVTPTTAQQYSSSSTMHSFPHQHYPHHQPQPPPPPPQTQHYPPQHQYQQQYQHYRQHQQQHQSYQPQQHQSYQPQQHQPYQPQQQPFYQNTPYDYRPPPPKPPEPAPVLGTNIYYDSESLTTTAAAQYHNTDKIVAIVNPALPPMNVDSSHVAPTAVTVTAERSMFEEFNRRRRRGLQFFAVAVLMIFLLLTIIMWNTE